MQPIARHNHGEPREFDMSKHSLRHIALRIAYLGTAYQGFASQKHTTATVEEQLFCALEKTCLVESRSRFKHSTEPPISNTDHQLRLFSRGSNRQRRPRLWQCRRLPRAQQNSPSSPLLQPNGVRSQPSKRISKRFG